ncbi:MAG TPA: hypothetical protein VM389_11720 [Phycisphaerae bacterium]|nr:hypothetical protein [Phycisphaerae bacterium]HUU58339.1 hypothetical protein [Phycisphaerae bacterium]
MTMPSVHEAEKIEAAPPRTSTWPVVLGVLSIVAGFQAMRLLGPMSPTLLKYLLRRYSQGGLGAIVTAFPMSSLLLLGVCACTAALGILAGVLLLLRRRVALVLHWLYGLAAVAAQAMFVEAVLQGAGNGTQIYGLFSRVGLCLVYPVLVTVWFSRRGVRRQMRFWRRRAGRMASKPADPLWPAVVGALALYWGAIGALSALLAGIGSFLPPAYSRIHTDFVPGWERLAAALCMLILAVLSVAWGVLLRRRRRAGAALCWAFIVGSLIFALASPVLAFVRWIELVGDLRFVLDEVISVSSRSVALLAWPAFLLIWLARPKIRAQVRSWGRGASPVVPEVSS